MKIVVYCFYFVVVKSEGKIGLEKNNRVKVNGR